MSNFGPSFFLSVKKDDKGKEIHYMRVRHPSKNEFQTVYLSHVEFNGIMDQWRTTPATVGEVISVETGGVLNHSLKLRK